MSYIQARSPNLPRAIINLSTPQIAVLVDGHQTNTYNLGQEKNRESQTKIDTCQIRPAQITNKSRVTGRHATFS